MKNVNAKKWMVLLLSIAMVLSVLAGCTSGGSGSGKAEVPESMTAPLNIGTLMGPTGMGMAGLISEENAPMMNVTVYDAPDQAMAGLLNGDLDVAAIPSNVAAVLYNKTEGGVPECAFKALMQNAGLAEDDIELVWMNSHADVVSTLISQGGYALVPEPQVTVAGSKADTVSVDLDINAMWKEAFGYDLPMGVVACRKEVAETRPGDLLYFLNEYNKVLESYNADKDAAAETIAAAGILPAAGIAKQAMPRCNIMLETGFDAAKGILTPLYETLFSYNPQAVGGKIPEDDFYFAKDHESNFSIKLEF